MNCGLKDYIWMEKKQGNGLIMEKVNFVFG